MFAPHILVLLLTLGLMPIALSNDATCIETQGIVTELLFETDNYRKPLDVHVYTPPCYVSTQEDYPVLYLMHGGGGSPQLWLSTVKMPELVDDLIQQQIIQPMILVMPRQFDYGVGFVDFLQSDIVPVINMEFRTIPDTQSKGILGISAGGGTVTQLALGQENSLFGNIAIIAGINSVNQDLIAENIIKLSQQEMHPNVLLDVGDADGLRKHHEKLKALFDDAAIEITYWMDEGGHNLQYFLPRFDDYLIWFDEHFKSE